MPDTLRRSLASAPLRAQSDVDVGGPAAEIARLRNELEAQARVIREQAAALNHSRNIFEQASAAARVGVWECGLPHQTLAWTNQVYELFEIPRGSALHREQILEFYTPHSLQRLEEVRSKAIAERHGFNLDAEIITAKGRSRWIRLTATVECERGVPVRIFGMKQDITEEKSLTERLRRLADFDDLTGLANRSSFQAKLADLAKRGDGGAPFSALLLIDLDGFKQVNDTFGHALGDELLRGAARRLREVCGELDFVARIGGDEFAVLLAAHHSHDEIVGIAGQIVDALRNPVDGGHWPLKVGASVGIARIGTLNPVELFNEADAALYAAKAAGRNTFRMFSAVDFRPMPNNPARLTTPHR